jgi:hypothetical protein
LSCRPGATGIFEEIRTDLKITLSCSSFLPTFQDSDVQLFPLEECIEATIYIVDEPERITPAFEPIRPAGAQARSYKKTFYFRTLSMRLFCQGVQVPQNAHGIFFANPL